MDKQGVTVGKKEIHFERMLRASLIKNLINVCGLAIASPHTSLHHKQRTHKYMIYCHNTHNNGIFIILTCDFS